MSRRVPQPMPKGWDEVWSDTEGGSLFLDRDGNPITLQQWATYVSDDEYKFVAWTQVTDTLLVMTVWVGMTGDFDNEERPLIFATGVLAADPERASADLGLLGLLEEQMSATLDEALRTHYRHVFESAYRGVPGMTDVVLAPFTDAQVEQLNRYQGSGVMHEFTCGRPHPAHVTLVATNDGWVCPDPTCGYTQNWAHAFMADKDRLDDLLVTGSFRFPPRRPPEADATS